MNRVSPSRVTNAKFVGFVLSWRPSETWMLKLWLKKYSRPPPSRKRIPVDEFTFAALGENETIPKAPPTNGESGCHGPRRK
jgi:hypothetical protein